MQPTPRFLHGAPTVPQTVLGGSPGHPPTSATLIVKQQNSIPITSFVYFFLLWISHYLPLRCKHHTSYFGSVCKLFQTRLRSFLVFLCAKASPTFFPPLYKRITEYQQPLNPPLFREKNKNKNKINPNSTLIHTQSTPT